MLETLWQNSYYTTVFLDRIRQEYLGQKILLLWDGSPVHRGKVKEYLRGKDDIEIMYFPPYSPELNPQEHVWRETRRGVSHNHEIFKFEQLTNKFYNFLMDNTFKSNFLNKYGNEIKHQDKPDNKEALKQDGFIKHCLIKACL